MTVKDERIGSSSLLHYKYEKSGVFISRTIDTHVGIILIVSITFGISKSKHSILCFEQSDFL